MNAQIPILKHLSAISLFSFAVIYERGICKNFNYIED